MKTNKIQFQKRQQTFSSSSSSSQRNSINSNKNNDSKSKQNKQQRNQQCKHENVEVTSKPSKVRSSIYDDGYNHNDNEYYVDDEIECMIKTMCYKAFHKEVGNNSLVPTDNYKYVRSNVRGSPCINNVICADDSDPFDDNDRNDERSTNNNINLNLFEINHHHHDDEKWNINSKYNIKLEIESHINEHYLKSIHRTEQSMKLKFYNVKKQISDCIQILQLHHDDIVKKEIEYFDKLNHFRKLILIEAQEYFKSETYQHGCDEK